MSEVTFALLTATITEEQWAKLKKNFDDFQTKYPNGVVFIAAGIWVINRVEAELALIQLTEQLHRLKSPFVVAPVSSRPTISAEDSGLQRAREIGLAFYPMPFAK